MKPICFIAARGGSKGVPRKNIRPLAGKPLIAHAIIAAKKSKIFSSIIVSTEDEKIAKIAKKYGADIPFLRPKKLASDTATMDDVLLHGIKKLQSLGYEFDEVVVRDCTVPFILIKDIQDSLSVLKNNKCDIVCGVYKQHHNPYFNMMEPNSKGFLHFSKKTRDSVVGRQQAPVVYQLNGLFAISVKQFLKYKKFYMPKILPHEIPYETGLMIDTEFEFQLAECIAKIKFR